jgi:hypothetical protein
MKCLRIFNLEFIPLQTRTKVYEQALELPMASNDVVLGALSTPYEPTSEVVAY